MTTAPMMQGVQNPKIMYRSDPLPDAMRERLRAPGYAPHATDLLMKRLPVVYSEGGLIVEYPNGRRIKVKRHKEYDEAGTFRRYRYEVVEELPPAAS
ncbi:hypothetical protein DAETH_07880 [Deinococcus aetherius]|uniref:Uncharacterized protein n=1 Tax=Deinococcus aetherius TaxID=200252 RepID=A0ABM8AAN8_9DEIO|nr:hypothetical protein [Deinococcus aetherius]BDP40819.1 hypothetical protein DAETH_07880 [Deinococcus aetherius]